MATKKVARGTRAPKKSAEQPVSIGTAERTVVTEYRANCPYPTQAFDNAKIAAHVALNYRRESVEAVALEVFEDMARHRFFSCSDPRRILKEIERRLVAARTKPYVAEFESAKRQVRLVRGGDTNVIRLYLDGMHGGPEAIVLGLGSVRDLVRAQRRKELGDLTEGPVANDTSPDSDEVLMSPRMSVRMAMKGRLARIMAESARAEAP